MSKPVLKKEIGVWGLSFNLMNTIIGAGIFALPAIVAAGLGPASFIAYLFCGILVALIMLCFAEVGSMVDAPGGVYGYIDRTLGDYFGFKAAVLLILAAVSADAAVANALVDVIDSLFQFNFPRWMRALFHLVIFSGLAWINVKGVRQGLSVVKLFTLAKLIPLLLFVILTSGDIQVSHLRLEGMPSLDAVGSTSLVLFFAFMGAEGALSISGEVRNPQKTIPRGIFIAIGGILLLYMLVQGAALGVLGPELQKHQENPLGQVALHVLGPIGLTLMIIGTGVSMMGNLSSEVFSIPRVLWSASRDRVFPSKLLTSIHPKFATPHVAIISYATLNFLFASFGGFKKLAILSTSSVLLIYFGMVIAVIVLRIRKFPRPEGSFRIPGGFIVPVLAGVAIIWFLTHLTIREFIAISSIIAALTVVYFTVLRRIKRKDQKLHADRPGGDVN